MSELDKLKRFYEEKKAEIDKFLQECAALGQSNDAEKLFSELCYCLLTPQVNADDARDIWRHLQSTKLLFRGTVREIEGSLGGWQYRRPDKAVYLCEARERFFDERGEAGIVALVRALSATDPREARDMLANPRRRSKIRGLGMKEGSHFLRNLGLSHNQLAILDRYILNWLVRFEVIGEVPNNLTNGSSRRYMFRH